MVSQKIILVVEDNEINRAMLCAILEPEYKVLEAENGLEALKVLNDQKDNISLILLDIVMPVMDGYTFLSILKNDPSISSIPVIVATQNDNEAPRCRMGQRILWPSRIGRRSFCTVLPASSVCGKTPQWSISFAMIG